MISSSLPAQRLESSASGLARASRSPDADAPGVERLQQVRRDVPGRAGDHWCTGERRQRACEDVAAEAVRLRELDRSVDLEDGVAVAGGQQVDADERAPERG